MADASTAQSTNLFFLRLDSWENVQASLHLLNEAKPNLLKNNDPQMVKFFEYFDQIFFASGRYNRKNIFDTIDISTLCFLQPLVIKAFIQDPTNLVWSSVVFQQFSIISAATLGVSVEGLKEYDLEEILHIINGTADVYDPFVFVYTLRILLEKNELDDRVAALFLTLGSVSSENFEFPQYFWQGALEFSLVLQLMWKNFVFFGTAQQEFLLQNYFYSAVVAGVPVEYWIKKILSLNVPEVDTQAANAFFLRSLEKNYETIPTNTIGLIKKHLSEIFSEYVGSVYTSEIKTLAQEKFIDNIYKGQMEDKKFSEWLRTVLQIYYNLRTKAYLEF